MLISYNQFTRLCYTESHCWTKKQVFGMYLRTDRWSDLREQRLEMDNHRCRMCNSDATCVHHRRYPEIYGEESVDDLTSLCNRCHQNFHLPPQVEDIKKEFEDKIGKGAKCPVCSRYTKKYKRKLNSGMARILIAIHKKFENSPPQDGWLHISKNFLVDQLNAVAQEYSKLKYWGLLEPKTNEDDTKNGSGYWRITDLGHQFVLGKTKVKKHVILLNKELIDFSEDDIDIHQALGDKFNYHELMNSIV